VSVCVRRSSVSFDKCIFIDAPPRGQLCTDLEVGITSFFVSASEQSIGNYTREIPSTTICRSHTRTRRPRTTVCSSVPLSPSSLTFSPLRVHAHAASAFINFCEGVERETLLPYLDPIVERLMKLLNPGAAEGAVKRYVQEQTITTLAMVADASERTFAKVGQMVFLAVNISVDTDVLNWR